ncbi:MAG: hypothetical protein COT31_02160 [Candidatus Moranbacteria bacterium CG08_land_8_20_14_0_20_34_16]|nr:MAG: hypothetical protein COT31_02160 [Candidatus Moranbacteria bacterium CG08_land_8_20_14_0_20_34_16]
MGKGLENTGYLSCVARISAFSYFNRITTVARYFFPERPKRVWEIIKLLNPLGLAWGKNQLQ